MKCCVPKARRGFTIIEVLVSSVLLGFLFITVIFFIQKGRYIEMLAMQRRTARALLEDLFEGPYDYSNFQIINDLSNTISLNNVTYTLNVTASDVTIATQSANDVAGKKINAQVRWSNINDKGIVISDSMVLEKWIANL